MTSISLMRARVTLVVAAFALTLCAFASTAQARKVANPGSVTFTAVGGVLKVGTLDEASLTPNPGDPAVTLTGSVDASGNIVVPQSNIVFPPQSFDTGSVGVATVSIRPVGNATGILNPLTGQGTINFNFYIAITGISLLGNSCTIGTSGSPIALHMTTGTSGSRVGTPYDFTTGLVTDVDGTFAVPKSSGCGLGASTVDGQLGLPSNSGSNYLDLTSSLSPAPQPGVKASFVANPSVGPAPLNTTFNASSSTVLAAPAQYRWDYDNNGTVDYTTSNPTDPSAAHTYGSVGNYTARLTVVDADGDASTTTRAIIVEVPHPDLALTKQAVDGPFRTGETHEYAIGVQNVGSLGTTGTVTVTDTLPAGMAFAGSTGADWTCGELLGVVTCTYAPGLAIGEAAPELRIQVTPGEDAVGFTTNTATAATADDPNTSNDSASATVETLRSGVDLEVVKTHNADDSLLRGRRATYEIAVTNKGTAATSARTRVQDTLPAGVAYVSASGTGWTCSAADLPTVKCFNDTVVGAGESLGTLRIRVDVANDAPDILSNTATMTNTGDTATANNSSTDLGSVSGYGADFRLTVTHTDPFIVDQSGSYTLKVDNVGTRTAANPVTVTDVLPAGLTPTSAGGAGWACNIAGQQVTCTNPGPVEAGNGPAAITIAVAVDESAAGVVDNIAQVSSSEDFNGDNDIATDTTNVRSPRPDLAIEVTHAATSFTVGNSYNVDLAVTNAGPEPTHGTIIVGDTLPAGLGYTTASGSGWSCGAVGQVVTCTRTSPRLEPGQTTHITMVVSVGAAAYPNVVNTATVTVAGDTNPANDSDSDPAAVVLPKKATTLVADAAGLTLIRQGLLLATGLDGLHAKLTGPGGAPLGNKRVSFRTSAGNVICEAYTNVAGDARCGTLLISAIKGILGNLYSATFAGDDDYLGSSDTGGILQLGGIKL